jgi:hypothetical protein
MTRMKFFTSLRRGDDDAGMTPKKAPMTAQEYVTGLLDWVESMCDEEDEEDDDVRNR